MEELLKEFNDPEKHSSERTLRNLRNALSRVEKSNQKRSTDRDRLSEVKENLRTTFLSMRTALRLMDAGKQEVKLAGSIPPQRFELKEISLATNNFSDKSLVKKSALGKMYTGQVSEEGGKNFAIRRLDYMCGQGDGFQTEISMSGRNKHIVTVHGFCDEINEKVIIYKNTQIFHGTLDRHLRNPILTWSLRLEICLGVALGLNHIHYDVIHCDINSSKIFLDTHWVPRIYGFELSTKYPQSWRHRLLFSRYFDTNNLTPKYDVYCFGVLLLEVLCGRKPMITNYGVEEEPDEIIDPSLRKQMDTQSLSRFKRLAYKCLNQQPMQRPTMDQIVIELEEVLELHQKFGDLELSKAADGGSSSNNLEIDSLAIPLSDISRATNDFTACWIGSGGFADVYVAELDVLDIQSGSSTKRNSKDELSKIRKTVAIKKIKDEQGKEGFLREIKLLTCCKHENIISLLGYSREGHILVYEFASNGSLKDYLVKMSDGKMASLTWAQRIQICLDIAHGINYLHTELEGDLRILHRDIKSDNILLDENMKAKLSDFGLSKSIPIKEQPSSVNTKYIVGTKYYTDPEYSVTAKYKKESDIYSFGVVLFEVLSGRVAYHSIYLGENDMGLAAIARRRFNEKTLKELIDPKMIEEDDDHIFTLNRGPSQDSFHAFSEIAYWCLAETQARRPTIEVVINELQKALELQGETVALTRFRLNDIALATENFAETYRTGLDTTGMLYKVELDRFGSNSSLVSERKNNGESSNEYITVAIKRFTSREGGQGKQEFFEEIEMRGYKHRNIVSILGFCDQGDEMILVYENASDRSLDDYLKNVDDMDNFTWTHRLRMCLEIARGLGHLHTKMAKLQTVIHNDIRSATILLDKKGEAKIASFGISKLHPTDQEVNIKVYEDPEYEKTGKVKKGSDVYSFGVVLFEIFCGRVAYDPVYTVKNDKGLAAIARQCLHDGTIESIVDPKLKEETDGDAFASNRGFNKDSLDTFLKVAHQCLGESSKRPTMNFVIKQLETALKFHENALKSLQVSVKDIESATEKFGEKNRIGSDRFWKVYKGELAFPRGHANASNVSGCTTIAAKRWNSKFDQGDHQFRTEFNILSKCRHENIIGLVGYCHEMDEKIIVYEHMSNGSLDKYLKDANLTWRNRLEICIDVASGLEFLHQGDVTRKKVVHRDIKSSSILLNDAWKAKISNLELSALDSLHQDMEHANDNAYTTFGYLDPQYKQGFLTEKSDIYSFGVMLFEILCGRLAGVEDCKDHSGQSLGPLAKRCYKEGKLDEIVFEGIKEQIGPESLATFADTAYQCLHAKSEERPTAREVVIQLKKALDDQDDYEIWETKLPKDYKEILRMSENPEIYSTAKRKDLYDIFSKGILIQDGKVRFSLGSNGERHEMASANQFHGSHKWLSVPESRFDKIAEMLDISNMNIQINTRSQSLSSGVNYGVYLVFKFYGPRKSVAKRMYVNLTYEMGDETLHAYFATCRDDEWMTIELYRFLNNKESDDSTDFEFLLKSFSRCYCGKRAVYVEGVELQAIDDVKHDGNNLMAVQEVPQPISGMDQMQELPTNDIPFDICSIFTQTLLKVFRWRNKEKQFIMLSANETFCDPYNANRLNLKPSTESGFQKVAELLSTQVFRIKCKIESKMLLENTEYSCYLVFKLSEKCCGLHCPVIKRDMHQRRNERSEVVYFRSPRAWNIDDANQVPQEREDGWMEVCVWRFKSNNEHQNDSVSINLKFVIYEGTMSGLIVCGLEFRPV